MLAPTPIPALTPVLVPWLLINVEGEVKVVGILTSVDDDAATIDPGRGSLVVGVIGDAPVAYEGLTVDFLEMLYSAGGGIQLTLVTVRIELGYARVLNRRDHEPTGNVILRLNFQNLF